LQQKIAQNPNIIIKIMTCPPEKIRQSPQKAKSIVVQLLSLGIKIGNESNIQAKFWLSDKWLAISSGDFNRMNLGHHTSGLHWKADSQLLLLDDNPCLIRDMKSVFEKEFNPIDAGKISSKDVITLIKQMANNNNLKRSEDACAYLARFKTALLIKTEQDARTVAETAIKLAKADGKIKLEGPYILMAIIIYYLQRREHRLSEIVETLSAVEVESQICKVIVQMEQRHRLVKSGDVYRIAPNLDDAPNTQRSINGF